MKLMERIDHINTIITEALGDDVAVPYGDRCCPVCEAHITQCECYGDEG